MPHIDVNLNEVEIPSGDAHEDGLLHVRVKKAEVKKPKEAGKYPYILFQLSPVGTDNKRPVFLRCSLHPDAIWNLKLFLQDGLGLSWNSDGSFNTDDTLGLEGKVSCTKTTYEGKPSNEIGPPYYRAA